MDGTTIELGANWVQGTTKKSKKSKHGQNPIMPWLKKAKLQYQKSNWDSVTVFDMKGKEYSDKDIPWGQAEKYLDCVQEWGLEQSKKMLKTDGYHHDDLSPLLVGAYCASWKIDSTIKSFLDWWYFSYEFGRDSNEISSMSSYLYNYKEWKDEDFFITDPRGFKQILIEMAKEFLGENLEDTNKQLFQNQKINKITYKTNGNNGCVAESKKYKFQGDLCVSTVSAGVLANSIGDEVSGQKNLINFNPTLPSYKKDLIRDIGNNMGIYTKIFIQFDKQFWPKWQFFGYAGMNFGEMPFWQNMNSYGKNFKNKNILMVTLVGRNAEIAADMTKEEVIQWAMKILRENIFPDKEINDPIDYYYKNWGKDPLYMGSYTAFPVNMVDQAATLLCKPVGTLYFAGEACDEKNWGYVHGAIQNGYDVAQILLNNDFQPGDNGKNDKYYSTCHPENLQE